MMKCIKHLLLIFTLIAIPLSSYAEQTYQVLCYHDIFKKSSISDDALVKAYAFNNIEYISENIVGRHDSDAVELAKLINQFAWLKDNNYNVITVQDLLDAKAGKRELPDKSILLTFDDGYESFYSYVYPLLKAYNYPAVLAIEGSWIAAPAGSLVSYGDEKIDRKYFLTREQIKEMSRDGLIEFASHTWNLHYGVLGNPQGNVMPAVTTRIYDPKTGSYEKDDAYQKRLKYDFDQNSFFIQQLVGKRPRVMVWPFGSYNGIAQSIADRAGMPISMSLDDGVNSVSDLQTSIKRYYIVGDPPLQGVTRMLEVPYKQTMRVMHVDLDYIYDADPVQQDKNLGLLLERINLAGANAVFLQAFSDDSGSGEASSMYFPNRHLPVKADLFSRASWQIRTRTSARQVYAWMPLLAFIPTDKKWHEKYSVQSLDDKSGIGYRRLSPFSSEARSYIQEIYEDLTKNAYISGILIHDDAALSDFEDTNPEALALYASWGLPSDVEQIRSDPALFAKWTHLKTEYLSKFAIQLRDAAEQFKKPLGLARNYYAGPILNPNAEEWFAQSYEDGLKHFDWVAIMAMPYFEKAENPTAWLNQVVEAVERIPGAQDKTIFELQAKDWNRNQPISNSELAGWMRMLRIKGIQNFGYYPDDPFANHPDINVIKRELSTKTTLDRTNPN